MRSLLLVLALPVSLILAGCPSEEPPPADDDDSAQSDGRIQVVGTGFFDTIQEAIDAAPSGGTILLGSGCYDEWFVVTKPLSISGESSTNTVVTGGGAGTAITVEEVTTGAVTINSLAVRVPRDEPATLRAIRVTGSTDVLVHDLDVGFETALAEGADPDICERVYLPGQVTGDCDNGLLGIDASQSTLLISETDIACVGFTSPTGGTGVLAQTDSNLTVTNSTIQAVGSFGIRTIDTALTVDDMSIVGVNRNSGAQDFESNGSAIFIEAGTGEAVVNGLTVENGVFVGLWVESPTLTVSNSSFTGFNYGVYMPGDAASASGRHLSITDSTFFDLRNEAVLATASATIAGSDFRIDTLLPPTLGGTTNSGVRLVGANTEHLVTNNTFDGLSARAIGFYGSNADGAIGSVTVEGNTITNVIAGNGLDVQIVDEAHVTANVIEGVDHAYNNDPNNPGSISTGFGIDCFFVDDCQLAGNTVIGAEFGNYVIVGSSFDSAEDTSSEGWSRGFHIETSQGTFTDPTVVDQLGYGILAVDSTIQGTGGTIADTARGPAIQDIDGNADPLPGETLYIQGGISLWVASQGGPTFLSWEDGTFADSASSAVSTIDAQVQLVGNRFLRGGYIDENGFYPSSAIYISGNDPQALSGPIFANNVVDGGEGSWGVYVSDGPGMMFTGNTVCAGSSTGLYLRESDGAVVEDSLFGTSDDPEVASCDSLVWSSAISLTQVEPTAITDGVTLRDLTIAAPTLSQGIYLTGLGSHTIEDVAITGASDAGIYATMSLPAGLTSDADGDGRRPYEGDCDDTNALIGFLAATDLPGDGLDNDCDGVTDDGTSTADGDADGYSIADGDCNDSDALVNPGMEEVVANFRDDNCDGWADFDGVYAWPELTISGTTIDSSQDGIWLSGVAAHLLDPAADGDPVNSVTNIDSIGVYVGSWQWSGTPLVRPGSVDIGAESVVGPTGSHCVSLAAAGSTATLSGSTLSSCGGHGVSITGAGLATLDGVTVIAPGGTGVYATNGVVEATDLTVSGAGDAAVSLVSPSADVTAVGLDVLGGDVGVSQFAGALVLDGLLSDGTANAAVSISGGVAALGGLDVLGAGSHGVAVSGGTVVVSGGSIGAVDEDGVHVSGSADVDVTDLAVGAVAGQGLGVAGGTVGWTGGSIVGPLQAGVAVSAGSVELEDLAISGTGGAGAIVSGGSLALTGGSVSGAGAAGVLALGGSLTMDGVEVSDATDDGVRLEGSAEASVLEATLDDNGGFGLSCDGGAADPLTSSVSLSACEAWVSGNAEGGFELVNGCELTAACTALPL
jgi:hypothetical protein